ncbi:MAG: TIGR03435 family protein [Bryobacteraceae bacterium]
MKKLMLWMIAFATLPGSALQAQNVTGSWQGTLEAGPQKLRIVVKISLEDDKLKATLYSIDQQAPGMPASTVTKDGSTIKIAIGGLGSYEGKLSGDGNAILGTWTQGAPMPLNLVRATPATAWTIPEPPRPPVRMAANANPAFEVATIKPSDPARPGKVFTVRDQDVMTVNTTLNDLITTAYDLHARQITGGPSWLDSDKYDLTGRPDVPGQPSVAQIKIMLQKLIADRFQLKFHREKKDLSVYAIGVAKGGAKISKSQADPNGLPGLFFGGGGPGGGMSFNVRNATMAEVASTLQGAVLDRPVVDRTGLAERYDFIVKFTPDAGQMAGFGQAGGPSPAADNPDAPPDLFAAFQQQLGLKIETSKATVDVLVIDKVEKPSAN